MCLCIYPWKHSNNLYEGVIGNWTSEHSSILFPTDAYYHTHNTMLTGDMQGTSTNPKASHHCFRMEHLPRPTAKQSFPVLLSITKTPHCWQESSQLATDLEQKQLLITSPPHKLVIKHANRWKQKLTSQLLACTPCWMLNLTQVTSFLLPWLA